jgi:hypothetical protein
MSHEAWSTLTDKEKKAFQYSVAMNKKTREHGYYWFIVVASVLLADELLSRANSKSETKL